MNGLGNDFVIIKDSDIPKNAEIKNFSLKISDRRCGIGCDQFIIYSELNSKVKTRIYNHDGSKALACGNASRCLSKLMFDTNGTKNIELDVDGRSVFCEYKNDEEIIINMGISSFSEKWMPNFDSLLFFSKRYLIQPKEMLCVDVGNPHLVIFAKLSDKDKQIIGKNLQNTSLFRDGVNVNFAKVENNKIFLKVWERGTGFTNSCGSGAVATFAAANRLGFIFDSAEIIFKLGSLKMKKIGDVITMSGSAKYSFSGEYYYE